MLRLKLDELLHQRRKNAVWLSEVTGIRHPTVKDMELNRSKAWSPSNLNKIMLALDIKDVGELIEYVEEDSGR